VKVKSEGWRWRPIAETLPFLCFDSAADADDFLLGVAGHEDEGATRFAGYNHLPGSIASAANGTLFVQTFNELWKVAPN
jgi:hypothetical protein